MVESTCLTLRLDQEALGGYYTVIPPSRLLSYSQLQWNFHDVDVLTQAGHSFQYVSSRNVPLDSLLLTNEINEVLHDYRFYPWMDKFFGDKADLSSTSAL